MNDVDPDKMLSLRECAEHFGLSLHWWRAAVKDKVLAAVRVGGPLGYQVKAGDARAFVTKFFEDHKTDPAVPDKETA